MVSLRSSFFDHYAVYSVCNFLIIFHINMYMVLFVTLVFHSHRRYISLCIFLAFRVRGGVRAHSLEQASGRSGADLDTDLRFYLPLFTFMGIDRNGPTAQRTGARRLEVGA